MTVTTAVSNPNQILKIIPRGGLYASFADRGKLIQSLRLPLVSSLLWKNLALVQSVHELFHVQALLHVDVCRFD